RIYWIQLGVPDRGSRIDRVDHLVLPLFSGWRCAHVNDRRRTHGRLHISLHHVAATGLRAAHGRNRALHRTGNRNVRDAQGGLVRARRELSHLGTDAKNNAALFLLPRFITDENQPPWSCLVCFRSVSAEKQTPRLPASDHRRQRIAGSLKCWDWSM